MWFSKVAQLNLQFLICVVVQIPQAESANEKALKA